MDQDPEAPEPEGVAEAGEEYGQVGLGLTDLGKPFLVERPAEAAFAPRRRDSRA